MNKIITFSEYRVQPAGEAVDVVFVPPLARRRLSPLQKVFFALANGLASDSCEEIVFASRDGEDTLTRRLVEDFHADGSVSPNRFSTSVYNAAPGLWSVHTKNQKPYTAIASGDDSIECGLIEALGMPTPVVLVYAEETDGGYGAAVKISASDDGRKVQITNSDDGTNCINFAAWVDFLSGKISCLKGRWITLRAI